MLYEVDYFQDDGTHHQGCRLSRNYVAAFDDEDTFGLQKRSDIERVP